MLNELPQHAILVSSHPRSGTHLMIDLLRRQYPACRSWKFPLEPNSRLYLSLEALYDDVKSKVSEERAVSILRRPDLPIVKTHQILGEVPTADTTRPGHLGRHWLDFLRDRARKIYMVRDGRKVLYSHFQLEQFDRPSDERTFSDFIREPFAGMSRARYWAHHVQAWTADPAVITIDMKSLTDRPEAVLSRLDTSLEMQHVGRQPLLPRRHRKPWHARLDRVFGVRPESSAILANTLKADRLTWQDVATPDDRRFLDLEMGDTLRQLGYA